MSYKFRIVKSGKDISSTDVRDYLIDDKYAIPKYHNEYTTSVTFNPGDKVKTASITHGLGYVPSFIPYFQRSDDSSCNIIPSIPYGVGFENWARCYADNQKIYFEYNIKSANDEGWNELIYGVNDQYSSKLGRSYFSVGSHSDFGWIYDGAIRFDNIALAKSTSITSANMEITISNVGADSGDINFKTYGIDEDDTNDFGSDPMGRTQTSEYISKTQSKATVPFNFGIDVKSIVEEINGRSGWSSGNAMGFLFFNNGTTGNKYLASSSYDHKLTIREPGTLTVNFRVIVFKDKIST